MAKLPTFEQFISDTSNESWIERTGLSKEQINALELPNNVWGMLIADNDFGLKSLWMDICHKYPKDQKDAWKNRNHELREKIRLNLDLSKNIFFKLVDKYSNLLDSKTSQNLRQNLDQNRIKLWFEKNKDSIANIASEESIANILTKVSDFVSGKAVDFLSKKLGISEDI